MAISQEIKYINANQLNVRSGAGKNFEIVTKASKNERVTVLSDNGSWTEVETESGEKGFVSSKFLSNSINENNDAKIGDYPIASIIVGLILVFFIAFFTSHLPVISSYISFLKSLLFKPSPVVALLCGSISINSTRLPILPNAALKFILVVVLPTPPF